VQRVVEVLDDAGAPSAGHRDHAGGAVVERTGQHDGDDLCRMGAGGGTEPHVDGGAVAVLTRTVRERDGVLEHDEVVVRRSDEDPAGLEPTAFAGVLGRKHTGAGEDRRQRAHPGAGHVQRHEETGREVRRQVGDEGAQRLHATG